MTLLAPLFVGNTTITSSNPLAHAQLENSHIVATINSMRTTIIKSRVTYGSVSYKVLNYARFKSRFNNGTFTTNDYMSFCNGQYTLSDIQRAIKSVIENGHMREVGHGRYRYIESGVLGKLENAYRMSSWGSRGFSGNRTDSPDDGLLGD